MGILQLHDRNDMSYLEFKCFNKKIYVCLNHRVAYLCWIDAYNKGVTKDAAFLFHVDHHADFFLTYDNLIDEQEKINNTDMKKMTDFVQKKLPVDNSEFIVPAMYKGIVGDALSVSRENDALCGKREYDRFKNLEKTWFKDHRGKVHNFYLCKSIHGLTGYHGLLTDNHNDFEGKKAFRNNHRNRNVILDIDLDFLLTVMTKMEHGL